MTILLALLLDLIFGDPKGVPHPIVFVGKLVSLYERLFYRLPQKRLAGLLFMLAVLLTVAAIILLLFWVCSLHWLPRLIVEVYLLYTALAWTSLKRECGYVAKALRNSDLPLARRMVSYVVGRDTERLDEEEIVKATVETIGENTIDGVLAPLFYMVIGWFCGLPVLFAYLYKTVNTLDSMVGYKNERYADFGFFSAKLDDVLNFIPARLGSLLMLLGGGLRGLDMKNGWRIFKRDRYAHNSPNSAQSESVMAGLLHIQLGGAHEYFGQMVVKPTIGDPDRPAEVADYDRSCRVLDAAVLLSVALFLLLGLTGGIVWNLDYTALIR